MTRGGRTWCEPGATVPWVKTSRDCALDALVVAGAVMIASQSPPRAASRMALLVCARRLGLIASPPRRDVLAELDACLARIRVGPGRQRQTLVAAMNMLVGGPWAVSVAEAAEQIGAAGGDGDAMALRAILSALALTPPSERTQ